MLGEEVLRNENKTNRKKKIMTEFINFKGFF